MTALTTLVGVVTGAALSRRSQQRQWSLDRQTSACLAVLRESSSLLVGLSVLSGRCSSSSAVPDWQAWNRTLAEVALVADHRIVEAANALDEEIWRVHLEVRRSPAPAEDWFERRERVEAARLMFNEQVRQKLTAPGPPLQRIMGRPAPDDPVWDRPRLR
ncbi:hypothetical protein OG422_31220 (plasmid) [Streptomyces sp. NBC_01525]|uniref:hypothetical protein n=1 Tax=Streptomyces sp. NBC_01525 TaxID=2903893 RepID=UPI003867428F